MKRFLFGFFLGLFSLWLGSAEAQVQGPIYCNNSVFTALIATATTTAVIPQPATGSAHTYICGWNLYTATVSGMTVTFEYGTTVSTPCDTGAHAITPPVQAATSNSIYSDPSDLFRGLEVPAGNGLCVVTAGTTVAVQVQVFYAQQ